MLYVIKSTSSYNDSKSLMYHKRKKTSSRVYTVLKLIVNSEKRKSNVEVEHDFL